jgi:integrase
MHAQLMKACAKIPDQKIKRRDKAIISLMYAVGMRRAEVAALDLASYNQDDHRPAIIVGTVEHATKTRKARVVPLPFATAALIDRYLVQRGPAPGPLFLPQRGERLTPAGIGQLFDRTKARAGITGPLGTHSNRRGFTCSARRADMSTDAIMEIAGWDSDLMVRRYSASEKTELAHDEFFTKMGGSRTALLRSSGSCEAL